VQVNGTRNVFFDRFLSVGGAKVSGFFLIQKFILHNTRAQSEHAEFFELEIEPGASTQELTLD
jgi:hypothetical protein